MTPSMYPLLRLAAVATFIGQLGCVGGNDAPSEPVSGESNTASIQVELHNGDAHSQQLFVSGDAMCRQQTRTVTIASQATSSLRLQPGSHLCLAPDSFGYPVDAGSHYLLQGGMFMQTAAARAGRTH